VLCFFGGGWWLVFWVFLVVGGFVGWCSSVFGVVWCGVCLGVVEVCVGGLVGVGGFVGWLFVFGFGFLVWCLVVLGVVGGGVVLWRGVFSAGGGGCSVRKGEV
ncbi:hypothetical protein, partial [Escherichia coli]|uniref:hypothetical protein n=1 Tax=Escherichia coli TaxID=562 RepID=UPI003D360A3B